MGLSAALLALGLAARLPLLWSFPAVHGGDSVARLAHSDRLLLAYQLPLPQAIVLACRFLAPDPFWTRLVFAVIGALVPLALAHALARASGPRAGWIGGALLALHPAFVYYSVVPYQESAMLLFLLAGAAAVLASRVPLAAFLLGLACLCRYEAWLAAALVGAVLAVRRRSAWPLLAFAWAPLLWIACWGGLAPAGTYVLDVDPLTGRLHRLPDLAGKLVDYSGPPLLALAFLGALVAARRRERAVGWGALYVVGFLVLVALAGHEWPPGSGTVSERLVHVPAAAACALAGLALSAVLTGHRARTFRAVLVAALVVVIALHWHRQTRAQIAAANEAPSLRLASWLASAAAARLRPGEVLAVVGPPVPEAALDDYVRKVVAAGGSADRAREVVARLGSGSPDRDLIAAHLACPPRLVVSGEAPGAALLVVYDDAPQSGAWSNRIPAGRFSAPPRGARLFVLR